MNKWLTLTCILLCLIGCLTTIHFLSNPSTRSSTGENGFTFEGKNGEAVIIYNISETNEYQFLTNRPVVINKPQKPNFIKQMIAHFRKEIIFSSIVSNTELSNTSSTEFWTFGTKTMNDVYSEGSLATEHPALYLELDLIDRTGAALTPTLAITQQSKMVSELNWDSDGALEGIGKQTDARIATFIEITDGSGGWVKMQGPFRMDMQDSRSIFVSHIYPRNLKKLPLRIHTPNSHPFIVEINNPSTLAGSPCPPFDPAPLTQVQTISDAEFSIEEVYTRYARAPYTPHDLRVYFTTKPKKEYQPVDRQIYNVHLRTIEDHYGNRTIPEEFYFLPGVSTMKLHCEAELNNLIYVWKKSDVKLVAKTTLNYTSTPIPLEITTQDPDLGVISGTFEFQNLEGSKPVIKLAFEPVTESWGNTDHFVPIIFVDEQEYSNESTGVGGVSLSTDVDEVNGTTTTTYSVEVEISRWEPKPEDFGKTIFIALPPLGANIDKPVGFTIPVPEEFRRRQ
ncbi:MAG: hypothetical protein AAF226_01515 [Verrucomicrobiota bacterium]